MAILTLACLKPKQPRTYLGRLKSLRLHLEVWSEQGLEFLLNDVVFLVCEERVKNSHLIFQHTSDKDSTEPTMQIEGSLVCILPRRSYKILNDNKPHKVTIQGL